MSLKHLQFAREPMRTTGPLLV